MKRRTLLGGALVFGAIGPAQPPAASLVGLFADKRCASRLGRAYLDGLDEPPSADALARFVRQELSGTGKLRTQVAAAIQRDFAAGRLACVDGWLLSLTEARLCGLAVLA